MQRSSRLILKICAAVLILAFGCFVLAFVIASVYQASEGGGSLSEVIRNVSLPEDSDNGTRSDTSISSLEFAEIQSNYRDLNDDQWREYALGILGSRFNWSGKVTDKNNRSVEIDMGSDPLRYLYLIGLPEDMKEKVSIGDTIRFEGRLQSFHLTKGMSIVLDFVVIAND